MSKYNPPYFGSDYYPEDWSDEELVKDAEKMRECGMNVARIAEFAWSKMEPREGHFEFAWLHRVVDTLAQYGVATILGTPTATPPVWLGRKYPDIFLEQESGRRRAHGGRRHCCSNNPHYREYCARIVEKMAQEFADDENVIGWQIDNEIYAAAHWWTGQSAVVGCFCPVCQEAFRRRLQAKFGTPEAMNKAWNLGVFSQEYSDFDEVPAPRDAWVNPHQRLEWNTFQQESHIAFVHMQADILHKYVHVPVGTDIMPVHGLDYVKLHEKLDVVMFNHYNEPKNLWTLPFWFDMLRPLKKGVPFWNTETATCWNGSNSIDQSVKPEGFCYANSLMPLALGGEANLYWLWRTHWGGHELMHGAVLDASGRPMHIYDEVCRTGRAMRKAAEFLNATRVKTSIALHFPTRIWNMFAAQPVLPPATMPYLDTVRPYFYKPLQAELQRCDIIESGSALDDYRLLVTPMCLTLEENGMAERIRKWVEAGGVWIVGPLTDVRDIEGARYRDRPFGMLEEMTGVIWKYALPDRDGEVVCQWEDGTPVKTGPWLELYEADQKSLAKVVSAPHGALNGKSILLRKRVGKGVVYVLGALMELEAMRRLYRMAMADAKIAPEEGDGLSFLAAERVGENGLHGKVLLEYAGKGGEYQLDFSAKEILSGKEYTPGRIKVEPYQMLVLKAR